MDPVIPLAELQAIYSVAEVDRSTRKPVSLSERSLHPSTTTPLPLPFAAVSDEGAAGFDWRTAGCSIFSCARGGCGVTCGGWRWCTAGTPPAP